MTLAVIETARVFFPSRKGLELPERIWYNGTYILEL
jgi:hypothetical protein